MIRFRVNATLDHTEPTMDSHRRRIWVSIRCLFAGSTARSISMFCSKLWISSDVCVLGGCIRHMLFRIVAWGVAVGNEQMNLVIIHAYVFDLLASMIYTCQIGPCQIGVFSLYVFFVYQFVVWIFMASGTISCVHNWHKSKIVYSSEIAGCLFQRWHASGVGLVCMLCDSAVSLYDACSVGLNVCVLLIKCL